jgi:hypothetical protein
VIFHVDGQAFIAGIERGAFGNGPGLEDSVELDAEIVMEAPRRVLLDDEDFLILTCRGAAARLRGFLEMALAFIFAKSRHA